MPSPQGSPTPADPIRPHRPPPFSPAIQARDAAIKERDDYIQQMLTAVQAQEQQREAQVQQLQLQLQQQQSAPSAEWAQHLQKATQELEARQKQVALGQTRGLSLLCQSLRSAEGAPRQGHGQGGGLCSQLCPSL